MNEEQAVEPQRGDVYAQIRILSVEAECLRDVYHQLVDKLTPVTDVCPGSSQEARPENAMAPLASDLRLTVDKYQSLKNDLMDLCARINI